MQLLSWNFRSTERKEFEYHSADLTNTNKPDIIILMEKKIVKSIGLKVVESLTIQNPMKNPREGFSGGMWLLWIDIVDFQREILLSTNGFIHCKLTDNIKHTYWFGTSIYGYLHLI